jgi:hypothetical protein
MIEDTSISIATLFYFPNNLDSIITSLRSVTSYFILNSKICDLEDIDLCPLKDSKSKIIELVSNQNHEYTYFEHPQSFKLTYPSEMKEFDFILYEKMIKSCIHYSERYPKLKLVLETFYNNEISSKLNLTTIQLEYLEKNVQGFSRNMVLPFFSAKFQFEDLSIQYMKSTDWQPILNGHVHACNILFSQILNEKVRSNILKSVYKVVILLSPRLQRIIHDRDKLNNLVFDFKREVNKIIGDHASFVNTNKISFRIWFLALSQFHMSCVPFTFPIRQSLTHLNMILYLCFTNDDIHSDQNISVHCNNAETLLSKHQSKKLRTIHPFVRNVYHPIYTA